MLEHDPSDIFDDGRLPTVEAKQRWEQLELSRGLIDLLNARATFQQAERHDGVNHEDAVGDEA